jgi:hypothetical protein
MKFRNLALGFVLLAASAFAADIDGKWSGSIDSPNGAVQIAFTFKADGATLTGTTTGPDGMEVKIDKGKIDGNNISFEVTIDFGGMPFTVPYTGVLNGENLALKAEFFGMPFEIAVKKSA